CLLSPDSCLQRCIHLKFAINCTGLARQELVVSVNSCCCPFSRHSDILFKHVSHSELPQFPGVPLKPTEFTYDDPHFFCSTRFSAASDPPILEAHQCNESKKGHPNVIRDNRTKPEGAFEFARRIRPNSSASRGKNRLLDARPRRAGK